MPHSCVPLLVSGRGKSSLPPHNFRYSPEILRDPALSGTREGRCARKRAVSGRGINFSDVKTAAGEVVGMAEGTVDSLLRFLTEVEALRGREETSRVLDRLLTDCGFAYYRL